MIYGSDPRLVQRLSLYTSIAAASAAAIGLWVLIGWTFDILAFLTWGAPQAMAPNAAACVVLAGVSLWLQRKPTQPGRMAAKTVAAKILAGMVVLISLLTLAEHLFKVDLNIDRLLLLAAPSGQIAHARVLMSPVAGAVLLLLSLALLPIDWRPARSPWPAQFFCFGALTSAFFGLLSLVLGPVVSSITVALPAVVCYVALATGLLCSRADWVIGGILTSHSLGARMFRRATPAGLLVLCLIGIVVYGPLLTAPHFNWVQLSVLAMLSSLGLAGFVAWLSYLAEHTLSAVIASAMDAIISVDEQQRILLFNLAAEKMFLCPVERAIGQPITRFLPSYGTPEMPLGVRAGGEEFQIEASVSEIETAGKIMSTIILRDVTERKQAEEARERLAAVVDWSDDAIISKTLDGAITAWNRGAEKVFGYTAQEVVGKSIRILMPPDRLHEEDEILAHISRGESVEHFETLRVRKDGRIIDVSVTISPMKDGQGKIIGASKITRDITERKLREAELRESEERFRLFIEHAPAGLAMFDREMRYLHVSRRWRTDNDLGDRDLRGVSHYQVFPEIPEHWKQAHRRGLAGQVLRGENDRFERADSSVQWIRWEIRPWLDRTGAIGGIVVFTEDITERTNAEVALREKEHLLSESQRIARLGSWSLDLADASGRIKWSEELYRIFGVSPETFTPTVESFLDLIVPEHRPAMQRWLAACTAGEKPGDLEFQINRPDGTMRYISGRGELQRDAQNGLTLMAGSAQDITERKLAQDALRESEERFQAMANGIPQLAWMAEAEGAVFWFNQRWYEYTGTAFEQMQGWAWQSLSDPSELPLVREKWRFALATGEPLDMEFHLRGADGLYRTFLTRVMPVKDPAGRVLRWFGTHTDISERKQAEQALARQAEELATSRQTLERQTLLFKLVLDSMGEGLVAASPDGRFLLWNDSATSLMGRDAADLPTEQWTPYYQVYLPDGVTPYPPEQLPLVRALRGESVQCELIVRHPQNGRAAFMEVTARPMKDTTGNLCGGVAVLRDITERKEVEEVLAGQAGELSRQAAQLLRSRQELEAQKLMLQSVLDSMSEGLVTTDQQGKFGIWNPAAERIVGLGAANVPSEEWSAHYGLYLPDTVTPFPVDQNPLLRARLGEVSTAEMYLRKAGSGAGVWIECNASPLRDRDGVLHGGVVAFRDITQRKTDEREIRKLNDELEEKVLQRTTQLETANRELEAFTYSVSHDLRAPLRHIAGFASICAEEFGTSLPPRALHYLGRIKDGATRMGQLVDELLSLSRMGKRGLSRQSTDLDSIASEVISMLQIETAGREVEWKIGKLPVVDCDPILTKQIFQNLISNAIKYSRPRPHAVIEIGQTQENGQTVIFVRDNGVGFDMQYSDKLFGVFQRLHRPEEFEGTGVGLATVLRIVQKHGGRVWAQAQLDQGATFFFTLGNSKNEFASESRVSSAGRLTR